MVERFRSGALNVLVATDVGAEGLDFRRCALAAAFDAPRGAVRFVQCRGRARRRGARFLLLVPAGGGAACARAREALLRLEQ